MRHRLRKGVAVLALGALPLAGCTDAAGYDLDVLFGYFPVLSTMRGSVAYQPYELPRLPPPGSVPAIGPLGEVLPPFTQMQLDSVAAVLTNPLPATAEVLARGQVMYERQCSVCHGVVGDGAGSVVGPGRFPSATAVRDPATAARSDGYLYAVIRVGRGLMPAYGERISHEDRWAIVHYMRQLQGMQLPTPAEVHQPGVVPPATSPTAPPAAPVLQPQPGPAAPPPLSPDTPVDTVLNGQ